MWIEIEISYLTYGNITHAQTFLKQIPIIDEIWPKNSVK